MHSKTVFDCNATLDWIIWISLVGYVYQFLSDDGKMLAGEAKLSDPVSFVSANNKVSSRNCEKHGEETGLNLEFIGNNFYSKWV